MTPRVPYDPWIMWNSSGAGDRDDVMHAALVDVHRLAGARTFADLGGDRLDAGLVVEHATVLSPRRVGAVQARQRDVVEGDDLDRGRRS